MKFLDYLKNAVAALTLLTCSARGQWFQGMESVQSDIRTILLIRPDSSCALTNQTTTPRKMSEMQVNTWERFSKLQEAAGSEEQDPVALTQLAKSSQKPLTDEELASKIREMYHQRQDTDDSGEDEALKVDAVEVSSNEVRTVTSRSFSSLKELLGQNPYTWGPNVLMLQAARIEVDTNRNLHISLTPDPGAARYARNMSRAWTAQKMKYEWKLVLPGKILSSDLPSTQDSTTSVSLDAQKPESVDAAVKLMGAQLTITADLGGLKLDEPLDSKTLVQEVVKQRKSGSDIPITDAAGEFLAEPVGIQLSTVHYFPDGQKYLRDRPESAMFELSNTGAVVHAKLFPPKGREIKSVSGVRVKAAKDDKGRAIAGVLENAGEQGESEFVSFGSDGSEKSAAARIELHMELPAPDARSIDELNGEAVALTIGGWKEMTITNVQADAKKEIDIAEVLPGAKLIITKVSGTNPQKTVQATLEGPKDVGQLEVKIKLSGRQGGQSNMNERRSKTVGGKTTRNINIQAFEFDMGGGTSASTPLTLIVRCPQDVKRERVQFKLTALDLL